MMWRAQGLPHVKGMPATRIPESWQWDGAQTQAPSAKEALSPPAMPSRQAS